MITFLKGSILRVRGGFSKGDYVNFWWVELPRINSSRDKGNNMATNSEGYATKIILLCGPLRIIFFTGINIISPGNIFWRPHVWLVIEWMAKRDAVKPLCTTSCMLTACHKQPPIQKSQKTNSVSQATSPLLGITLLWVTTPCGQLLNFGMGWL